MPPAGPQSSHHRKTLAVKRADGEPLTRVDLQYDMLYHIFSDNHAVFTDPFTTIRGDRAGTKVTFRDLYVNALIHSPRCSKASRDRIRESPEFGNEFAMISLLSNVGRINTTMAFFPEMKTALRTYHPVPALQRTNGNLQDAPRIKNILKSCYLKGEAQGAVSKPADMLAKIRSGKVPPTSIVNVIFILASHATAIARSHFDSQANVDFLDLFTPVPISSASRARVFLWLCFYYHEGTSDNPYSDEHAGGNPDRAPRLVPLTPGEAAAENVDSPEEHQRGIDMTDIRRRFLESQARGEEFVKDYEPEYTRAPSTSTRGRGRGKGRAGVSRTRETSPAESMYSVPYSFGAREDDMLEGPGRPPARRMSSPGPDYAPGRRAPTPPYRHHPYLAPSPDSSAVPRAAADPYSRRPPSPGLDVLRHSNGKPTRTNSRKHREHSSRQPPPFIHESYRQPSGLSTYPRPNYSAPPKYAPPAAEVPKRTMLEQAWHVSMTTDPLVDSDDEAYADENTRLDYILRLRIISRLRGKDPTPPRELGPYSVDPTNRLVAYGAR
ncbi:hypothetical protein PYCCODRAFT_1464738 [Trametes coccinea BRFM310]|uniref:Ino eighty subunit 1 n=1 Tax=Trametes coccinea (strain BRFM310) TaxID=1353009 RepID=A0A1Y2IY21_TRAC3|nr:hypothetical protein PYCCODRAFT_1464738 [Trametes coccinea BRFM310]